MSKVLVLMQGPPGSGKSTVAAGMGCVRVSADDYMTEGGIYRFDPKRLGYAHDSCKNMARHHMAGAEPLVIVDNTNTRRSEVAPYYGMAEQYGYSVRVIRCSGAWPNAHGVPDERVRAMRDRMETLEEVER